MLKLFSRNSLINYSKHSIKYVLKKKSYTMSKSSISNCEIKFDTIYKTPDLNYLLWVDCEMTGLNILKDQLLEIALIITDNELNEVNRLGPLVLKCEKEILDSMNSWCKSTHSKTGLIAKALKSNLTPEKVDNFIFEMLEKHSIKGAILAGNSIMFDNLFIRKYLHKTSDLLHYRLLDVSSIKILKELWYPEMKKFHKENKHEALSDILESIEELKFYRKNMFK